LAVEKNGTGVDDRVGSYQDVVCSKSRFAK